MPAHPKEEQSFSVANIENLVALSQEIARMDTLDQVFEGLVRIAIEHVGAERGSLFLHDESSRELYTRVATGMDNREIRLMSHEGIVGSVFSSERAEIIDDVSADERFHTAVDELSGFETRSLLSCPIKNVHHRTIGVVQLLNKEIGVFDEADMSFVMGFAAQCAGSIQSLQFVENSNNERERELEFLQLVSDLTSELDLSLLLQKVMVEASRMLGAERSTLFLHDERTDELFSMIGQGIEASEIRIPSGLGIAGAVFRSGAAINIPHAYADLRFSPSMDQKTGYFTRSILCVPVLNKKGKVIGVTQTLNKKLGTFTDEDETRLKAFTAQVAVGLENAKLFEDVQQVKNYNESMLQSMSSGVLTIDVDGKINTCNVAAARIFDVEEKWLISQKVRAFLGKKNKGLLDLIDRVQDSRNAEILFDAEILLAASTVSANISILPLDAGDGQPIGVILMIEDISSEKRVKSTMSRYMDPDLANQLLDTTGAETFMAGQEVETTILFSDIRGFTSITEQLGARGTVQLLNEYFELMVSCISEQGGMVDKFIGDAIVAAFGIPAPIEASPDRALSASIKMLQVLSVWNAGRENNGLMPLDMGIGLNSDVVVAGNIGSKKRVDYTIIGDGVNLAARLESACKQYAAKILLSEFTRDKLQGVYKLREVDRVVVKGKTAPVSIFEALDFYDESNFPNMMEVVGNFNEGIASYRSQSWDRAINQFQQALRGNPNDRLSNAYIERCRKLKAEPPGDGWNGVWIMKSK